MAGAKIREMMKNAPRTAAIMPARDESETIAPMATPPNTLVLGPGGFSFNDYVKVGVPMCLISLVACVIIIPIFWPF